MPNLAGYGSLASVAEERINDKITRKFVCGQQSMIVWWNIKAGAQFASAQPPA
jgi:hypothetical protein